MTKKMFLDAIIKITAGVLLMGLLIFLPAGGFDYWQGWLLMAILFIPMFCAGVVMMLKNPELLKKRLNMKEKQGEQQAVVKLSGLMFVVGFVVCGFSHRFGWMQLPAWVSWVGAALFLMSYALYAEVLRENVYLSRTVEVQEGQKVIDTGLYGVVRHPMYAVTLVLFLSMPLILGSVIGFVVFLAYPLIIRKRILNEEEVLKEGLSGYKEYCEKVKYRLIPFVW